MHQNEATAFLRNRPEKTRPGRSMPAPAQALHPLRIQLTDQTPIQGELCNVKAAVIGGNSEQSEAYNQLTNGIIANIDVARMGITDDFSDCDIVFIDKLTDSSASIDADKIENYVKNKE